MTGASRPRSSHAPAPVSADVGVVAAMSVEVGFLLDRLGKVRKYAGPRHTVIEGEHAGKVIQVMVEYGQPVEYDEPLLIIE